MNNNKINAKNIVVLTGKVAIVLLFLIFFFRLFSGYIFPSSEDKLFTAIKNQDINAVNHALSEGANVNAFCSHGDTLLNIAITSGNTDIVKLLVSKGAYIDGQGDCATPLSVAIHENNENLVDYLISKNANVNETKIDNSIDFSAPIIMAVQRNNLSILGKLIEAKADVNKRDVSNRTALIVAAEDGNKEAVQILLKNGADISLQMNGCWNALDRAILERHTDVIQILKQQGAASHDVKILNNPEELMLRNWDICKVGLDK